MAQLLQQHQRLAGYEIIELVGRGGMGEVYRAKQLSMDRVVALKVLNLRAAKQDPSFADSFVQEARAAGRLGHPNIVAVHDVGSTTIEGHAETVHYFSMEFIEGESIKDLIKREGRCPDDLVPLVMNSMAEALTYAEKVGIVHRDIKPDNILLTTSRMVKLADLGLALQVGGEQVVDDKDPEARSKVMGTPMYMSPEQARAGKIDHRSDQYSLGATLFHMLTGRPPFQGADAKAVMRAHVFEPVPDPRDVRADVPDPWRQLCMRLLAKSPDARFAAAADLRAASHAAGHGIGLQSLSKRTPRIAPRPGDASRRTLGLAVGGVAVVLLGVGIAVALGGRSQAQAATTVPTTGPVTVGPDLARLRSIIGGLPADHAKALAELDGMTNAADWSHALAQKVIAEEAGKRRAAIEAAKRDVHKVALAAIAESIDQNRLQAAKEQLGALAAAHPEAAGQPTFKDLAARLDVALAAMAAAFRGRLEQAKAPADLDGVMAEAKASALDADAIGKLDQLAGKRRADLGSAAAERARMALRRSWEQLAFELEAKRVSLMHTEIPEVISGRVPSFPAEAHDTVKALSQLNELVSVGHDALRRHFKAKRQTVDGWLDGRRARFTVHEWSLAEVAVAEGDGAPQKLPRAQVRLDWSRMLDAAPLPDRKELPRIKAACLWMWRGEEQKESIDALGDQPLAHALHEVRRALAGGLDLAGAIEREGERLRVRYDFASKRQALLADFSGDGISLGDHGLLWTTTAHVTPNSLEEAPLPRAAWRAALRAPCTITAVFRLRDANLALAGVEGGGRRVRIGVGQGAVAHQRTGTLVTAEDGRRFNLLEGDSGYLYDPERPLTMTWTVAEDGRVGGRINDQQVRDEVIGKLPAGAPVTFILQAYQMQGQSTTIELVSLEAVGLPPN